MEDRRRERDEKIREMARMRKAAKRGMGRRDLGEKRQKREANGSGGMALRRVWLGHQTPWQRAPAL